MQQVDTGTVGVKTAAYLAVFLVFQAIAGTGFLLSIKSDLREEIAAKNISLTAEIAKLNGAVALLTQQNVSSLGPLTGIPAQVQELMSWRTNHEALVQDRRNQREADITRLNAATDDLEDRVDDLEAALLRLTDKATERAKP
jgi:cell division protein FtsB